MNVLIAEDDLTAGTMLAGLLEKWGYAVTMVADGAEALALLRQPAAPRLAILDWVMPGLHGVEVCRRLRAADADPQRPPYLILLTARDAQADIVQGLESGANDYLAKPYDPQELRVRLDIGRRLIAMQDQLLAQVQNLRHAEQELAEAWNREIQIAGRIQQSLLVGRLPGVLNGARLGSLSIPSRQVDGDFYDVFPIGDDCLDIVIGDVMGKGIQAAMLGAGAKGHLLRVLTSLLLRGGRQPPRPREVVASLHAAMSRELMDIGSFITLCYARLDVRHRRLVYVDCGHTGILHWHTHDRTGQFLHGTNMPLGFDPDERYDEVAVELARDDLLVFFSDGITEAARADGEHFGEARLLAAVSTRAQAEPRAILDGIRAAIGTFTGTSEFTDDFTALVVRLDRDREAERVGVRELALTSDPERLTEMRAAFKDFLGLDALRPLSARDRDLLVLAAQEAASNVIVHAYRGQRGQPLDVRMEAFPDALRFTLYHAGDNFVAGPVVPPREDGLQDGGYGLYLIDTAVDSCSYGRDPAGRLSVTLWKSLTPREEPQPWN